MNSNWIFIQFGLVLLACTYHVTARCSVYEIHVATKACLTNHLVDPDTDPLVPILNNSAAVVNFCLRHITDIKTCYMNVISACTSDKRVKVLFGSTGAALLSAFDGICKEPQKDHDMTCAYENYYGNISATVKTFISAVDSMDMQNTDFSGFCAPMHELHSKIMTIMDYAVGSGDCSEHSYQVMDQYLSTVVFPCNDVATTYYPCTLAKLNADAMECYSKNGVMVQNALVPTPGSLSNADEMCGSKSTILSCVKSLITKCLYEPQVTTLYGSAVEGFEASIECMCSPENFDMILSCAATADVTTPMTIFTQTVHNHTISGTLTRSKQCALERKLVNSIETAIAPTCNNANMKNHWRAYLSTVIYPCTEITTMCYPRNKYNGAAASNCRVSMATVLVMLLVGIGMVRCFL